MKTGIYIHIPFCLQKCHYCSFYSIPLEAGKRPGELFDRYTDRVCGEIRSVLGEGRFHVDTIYFGGGTPVLLPVNGLLSIIETVRACATVDADAEVSIETNPRVITASMGEELKQAGFNRITLGVQTLDHNAHHCIGRGGRLCSESDLSDFFSIAGVDHCIDMISGIPGIPVDAYLGQLDSILSFKPAHFSVYSLSIEEGTPLAERISENEDLEELQRILFLENAKRLVSAGYHHYEISNFCMPGKESRHNLKYWKYQPYAGFGPSAHSFINGRRWANSPDLDRYLSAGEFSRVEDVRTPLQATVEFFMTGLRLLEGVSLTSFEKIFKSDLPQSVNESAAALEKEGVLQRSVSAEGDEVIRIAESSLVIADNIIYRLLESLLP